MKAEIAVPVLMPPQADMPPGDTYQCPACGTRLRQGQPHSAVQPHPHQTLDCLVVRQ